MATDTLARREQTITRAMTGMIEANSDSIDPLAKRLQGMIHAAVGAAGKPGQRVKDFLHGVWLGHSLHPALSDAPAGAWYSAAMFDLIGSRRAADASIAFGIAAAIPTALSGVADWSDTSGKPRRIGLIHAVLNSAALGCYIWSLTSRKGNNRGLGVVLSTAGLTMVTASAWLGGELVFKHGTGVSRNAFDPEDNEFHIAARLEDIPEGQLFGAEIEIDGSPLPLVMLRRGGDVMALSAVCSHWAGPLADGKLLDGDCVQCPWHGSEFSMRDGSVRHGPAAYPQPVFETRVRDGNVEVRRAA